MTRKWVTHSIDIIKDALVIFLLYQLQGNLNESFLNWVSQDF